VTISVPKNGFVSSRLYLKAEIPAANNKADGMMHGLSKFI